jgi:hypothetical protein
VPTGRLVEVVQFVCENVATHKVVAPEVNVTVPVAVGRPDSERVELDPKGTFAGIALAANDVEALVTVKPVNAVEPP